MSTLSQVEKVKASNSMPLKIRSMVSALDIGHFWFRKKIDPDDYISSVGGLAGRTLVYKLTLQLN